MSSSDCIKSLSLATWEQGGDILGNGSTTHEYNLKTFNIFHFIILIHVDDAER